MADTTFPKKDLSTDAPDIAPRDGSNYHGTLSREACDIIFAFKAEAIAKDKRKRSIEVSCRNFCLIYGSSKGIIPL